MTQLVMLVVGLVVAVSGFQSPPRNGVETLKVQKITATPPSQSSNYQYEHQEPKEKQPPASHRDLES